LRGPSRHSPFALGQPKAAAYHLGRTTWLPIALCRVSGDKICGLCVPLLFPHSRSLCPASPSLQWVLWASVPHLPVRTPSVAFATGAYTYLAVLRSARTAHRPSWVPSLVARHPVPCLSSFVCVPSSRLADRLELSYPLPGLLFPVSTPSLLTYAKETMGSPRFPNYPRRCMPRSQTPVVSFALALSRSGLLPSSRCTPSAFPSLS
jgi:hypothetical protein